MLQFHSRWLSFPHAFTFSGCHCKQKGKYEIAADWAAPGAAPHCSACWGVQNTCRSKEGTIELKSPSMGTLRLIHCCTSLPAVMTVASSLANTQPHKSEQRKRRKRSCLLSASVTTGMNSNFLLLGFFCWSGILIFTFPWTSQDFTFPTSDVSHETSFQLGHHYRVSKHCFCRKIPAEKNLYTFI